MTICLKLAAATDLHELSLAVYRALKIDYPNQAREAVAIAAQFRDCSEYFCKLRELFPALDLAMEVEEARP